MEKITGKKLNMSQIFTDEGKVIPVTLVSVDEVLTKELENKDVVVVGTSKGKGFTGVMKKWNFRGAQATRGQKDKQRAAGSIGSQTPGRVWKGKKMAGRHGNYRVTIKGLKIVRVLPKEKTLMVSGPIPGARNSKVEINVK
jgi:large subunit ribosomal protein L3